MKIYLLRHGETDWNRQEILQGRTDIPLNSNGKKQAILWSNFFKNINIDIIISSPLIRARETADIISKGKNLKQLLIEENFIEKDFGKATGIQKELREKLYPDRNYEMMETWYNIIQRVSNALEKYIKIYYQHDILIVCHSSVIKALIQYVSKESEEIKDKYGINISPLGITEIEYNSITGYHLVSANKIILDMKGNQL